MLEATAGFNCVVIDRDVTPELCKKFAVNAYPSMVVLNADEQKLFRWSGFSDSAFFIKQLTESLARFALFKAGKDWDYDEPRAATIGAGTSSTRPAPASGIVQGVCVDADGTLWVHQGNSLFSLTKDAAAAAAEDAKWTEVAIPADPASGRTEGANDLCADAQFVYVCPFNWKAGGAIQRYNRKTGKFDAPIVAAADAGQRGYGTAGVASEGDFLWTIQRMGGQLAKLGKDGGDVVAELVVRMDGFRLHNTNGLSFDAASDTLVTAARIQAVAKDADGNPIRGVDRNTPMQYALLHIDPASGKVVRRIDLNYWCNSVAVHPGGGYVLGEQPTQFIDKNHTKRMVPAEPLIYRFTPPATTDEHDEAPGDDD